MEAVVFQPGHSKWDWDYTLGQEPDVFLTKSRGLGARHDFRFDFWEAESGGIEFYLRKSSLFRIQDPELQLTDQVSGRSYSRAEAEARRSR